MIGMLKAELFRFWKSSTLWIILGVITASCGISIFTGAYSSAEQASVNIAKDSMVPILACAVYGSILLTDDFSNGLMRHYVASGYKRYVILMAKLVHFLLGCSILLVVYPCLSVLLTAALQGVQTTLLCVFTETIRLCLKTLPLYWGMAGLFFLFATLIQRGSIAVSISVAASILLVVLTNKLYARAASVWIYSPIVQISEAADGRAANAYYWAVLISLTTLAACIWGGIVKCSRDEW